MAISGDYSSPVTVNGFSCRNCAEVDKAKRNIDPANPAGGPFGVNDHGKTAGKAGAAKNHFSAEARQQDLMEALHKVRAKPAANPAAAAYGAAGGGGPGGGAGQFVTISA
jgi:hypothetical protein